MGTGVYRCVRWEFEKVTVRISLLISQPICWRFRLNLDPGSATVEFQPHCRWSWAVEVPKASFEQHIWHQAHRSQLKAAPWTQVPWFCHSANWSCERDRLLEVSSCRSNRTFHGCSLGITIEIKLPGETRMILYTYSHITVGLLSTSHFPLHGFLELMAWYSKTILRS